MMKARVITYMLIKSACILLCGHLVEAFEWPTLDNAETQIVKKVLVECLERDTHDCLARKLSRAVEYSVDWDIPILNGITYKRNNIQVENLGSNETNSNSTGRIQFSGMDQLYNSITRFIDGHILSLDFSQVNIYSKSEPSENSRTIEDFSLRAGGGLKEGGGGFGGGGIKKIGKGERRRVQYALFVLLGIFALTAPLILKTLGLMAGKALIASKVALIMLGSIALKKIFQPDHSPVKVHTHTIPIHEDDHDRYDYGAYGAYHSANVGHPSKYYTKSPINLV